MENIQNRANEMAEKIKNDPALRAQFKNEPVKTIEDLLEVDLPDEQIDKIVAAVRGKASTSGLKDKVEDLLGRKE